MKNLAGDSDCDEHIRRELERTGIEVVVHSKPVPQEVPATLTGQQTKNGVVVFTFVRAWYYWMVDGPVPIAVAEEIYATRIGKDDIRAGGNAGRVAPSEHVWPDTHMVVEQGLAKDGMTVIDLVRVAKEHSIPLYVLTYHIDTEVGLFLFVETLRQHGLVD